MFISIEGEKIEDANGLDNQPLFHHYSWVKKKEEMLKKVSCWGHREDKDWEPLVHKEFSEEFRGEDCLYGLTYKEVYPFRDPLIVEEPIEPVEGPFQNVTKVTPHSLMKSQLEAKFS